MLLLGTWGRYNERDSWTLSILGHTCTAYVNCYRYFVRFKKCLGILRPTGFGCHLKYGNQDTVIRTFLRYSKCVGALEQQIGQIFGHRFAMLGCANRLFGGSCW